jgi:ferredoxin--NADP+ reductase
MYKILKKKVLNNQVVLNVVHAPWVARKCMPGQFIILRVNEEGERIPLTIADYDREAGTVTIIYQIVGKTTMMLSHLEEGDSIQDFVGPLGQPSEVEGLNKVAVIGGGLGCAIAYPQAKHLHQLGATVDIIAGFKNKDLIILEDEMRAACTNLHLVTDDGSNGHKGFVTDKLKELLEAGEKFDAVIAIGPLMMMKFVCKLTKEYGIKTIVSMNPVMVDGTGMCGGCRVTVGGETKFACVDGPDFDGHLVDFDEVIRRSTMYKPQERERADHYCNMMAQADKVAKEQEKE